MQESAQLSPTDEASTAETSTAAERISQLETALAESRKERDHLVATVEILQAASESLHFVDILQTIVAKLGATFGLDRCSVFLTGDSDEVRVMATYENPALRNLVVDVRRYPELKRALESGETVYIPDALSEPMLEPVRHTLDLRKVRSIIVVPIRWRGIVIGAIFVRTERDGSTFSDADLRFCQAVASLAARALHNAHRFEAAIRSQQDGNSTHKKAELQRIALIAFLRRLLDRATQAEGQMWSESLLPGSSDEELQRLVSVTLQVIETEARI